MNLSRNLWIWPRVAGLAAATGLLLAAAPVAPPDFTPRERAELRLALSGEETCGARDLPTDDAALIAATLRLANRSLGQRVRPSAVDFRWALEPPRRDVAGELAKARAEGRLADWLADLSPPFESYRALLAARCRYAAMAARGGWTPLPPGAAPAALRQRLLAEGYAAQPVADPAQFDAPLAAALALFQARHGLAADGALGVRTRAALDVPVAERLAQIEANLERWRWLPRGLEPDRLEVDIGGATATLFAAGEPVLEMKAIVGDPRHLTPMFASRLEAVVFNPPWRVPDSIARAELLPRNARQPGYLARNGFSFIDGRLVQRPGPRNALGQVKFDFDSPFGVYLHDTPGRAAFALPERALSHGCMRLEKPRELAALLLAPQGGSPGGVEAAIAAGATLRVPLRNRVPLYVVYRTVTVDAEGGVGFRRDVYDWDRKLIRALPPVPPGEDAS